MKPYRCRECGTVLFKSDASAGNVKVLCPNRQCKTRKSKPGTPPIIQTVPLGVGSGTRR